MVFLLVMLLSSHAKAQFVPPDPRDVFDDFVEGTGEKVNKRTGLWFDNKTRSTVWLCWGAPSKIRDQGGGIHTHWFSKGWYPIAPGKALRVFGKLKNRYYYYYAYNQTGKWTGGANSSSFWVHPTDRFWLDSTKTSLNSVQATQNGFRKYSFVRIDTGDSERHVQGLTE